MVLYKCRYSLINLNKPNIKPFKTLKHMKLFKLIILTLCFFEFIGCLYLFATLPNLDFVQVSFLFIICLICLIISFVIIENSNK